MEQVGFLPCLGLFLIDNCVQGNICALELLAKGDATQSDEFEQSKSQVKSLTTQQEVEKPCLDMFPIDKISDSLQFKSCQQLKIQK